MGCYFLKDSLLDLIMKVFFLIKKKKELILTFFLIFFEFNIILIYIFKVILVLLFFFFVKGIGFYLNDILIVFYYDKLYKNIIF